MLNHFETLCNLCAVSGDEQAVRSYLISVLEKRHLDNRPAGQPAGGKAWTESCATQADGQRPHG